MKNNKSEYTIKFVDKALTLISKHANLNEPETAKHFIAQLKDKNGEDIAIKSLLSPRRFREFGRGQLKAKQGLFQFPDICNY